MMQSRRADGQESVAAVADGQCLPRGEGVGERQWDGRRFLHKKARVGRRVEEKGPIFEAAGLDSQTPGVVMLRAMRPL